jgi:hypothetical protein
MEFWQEKLALVRGMGKEDIALRAEINREILRARNAAASEELAADVATLHAQEEAHKNNKDAQIADAVALTSLMDAIWGQQSAQYQNALREETRIRQEWEKKDEAILRVHTKMIEDAATAEIAIEQEGLNQQVALRQISLQQKFTQEQQFEQRLYALKMKALQDELATLDATTLAYAQVQAKIEALEQSHQLKLTTIANQAELDRKQFALQAAEDTQNALGTLLDDLISRTKTWKQSFQDAIKGLTSDLNKLASQQIAKQLLGPGTAGGGFLNNIFGKIFGGGAGASTDTAAQTAHTTALAADTAAYTVGTPAVELMFTTLTTAGQAAAAALAAVGTSGGLGSAFGSFGGGDLFGDAGVGFGNVGFASFDVGTPYVPQDTLAVVHKGEAIIPAAMNKGGAVATGPMHMHFYISGNPDSRTLDQIQAAAARGASKATRSVM